MQIPQKVRPFQKHLQKYSQDIPSADWLVLVRSQSIFICSGIGVT